MSLERLADAPAFSLIERRLGGSATNADSESEGARVCDCVPEMFEAYCKVLHTIWETDSADETVTWQDVRDLDPDDPVSRILQDATTVYQTYDGSEPARRVRWEELARRYDLTFHPQIHVSSFTHGAFDGSWPRYLYGPEDGWLDEESCGRLVDCLVPHTGAQRVDFRYVGHATADLEPHVYRGLLGDVTKFHELDEVQSLPQHWWPADLSWCVCCDYDLPFTLVGGSEALVEAIVDDDVLEALVVTPKMRVDSGSDSMNL